MSQMLVRMLLEILEQFIRKIPESISELMHEINKICEFDRNLKEVKYIWKTENFKNNSGNYQNKVFRRSAQPQNHRYGDDNHFPRINESRWSRQFF